VTSNTGWAAGLGGAIPAGKRQTIRRGSRCSRVGSIDRKGENIGAAVSRCPVLSPFFEFLKPGVARSSPAGRANSRSMLAHPERAEATSVAKAGRAHQPSHRW
jgi:hypothetical protein